MKNHKDNPLKSRDDIDFLINRRIVEGSVRHEEAVYFSEMLYILGWSKSKYYSFNSQTGKKWHYELEDAGVVMKQWQRRRNKYGKLMRAQPYIIAFPSRIRNWMALKAAKGQHI